jgi:hypothetical protein
MKRTWVLLTGAIASTGCATVINGGRQELALNVLPRGSIVCIDGKQAGTTPMVAKLSRKQSHMVRFEKAGYHTSVIAVTKEVNPWIVGNFVPLVLVPGPIGLLVDVATGAVHQLEPARFDFQLEPADTVEVQWEARPPCSPM